ncbi:MAG: hypothetical protein E7382_01625 [Clostridiales bacterium]|nr:hypothetical protein [Clostridiales bacterium]
MKINYLEKVKVDKKKYVVSDFFKSASSIENLAIKDGALKEGYRKNKVCDLSANQTPIDIYCFNNGLFFFTKDGVYSVENGKASLLANANQLEGASLYRINYMGEKRTLLLCKDRAFFVDGQKEEVSLPYKKHGAVLGAKLFLGEGNIVAFGETNDLTGFSNSANTICLPERLGEIVGVFPDGKELLIFCKSAVARLKAFGEGIDYQLEVQDLPVLDVKEGSIVDVGNGFAFINNNSLCLLKNKKVSELPTSVDLKEITFGKCARIGREVMLVYKTKEGNSYVLVKDTESGNEAVYNTDSVAVGCGGFIVSDNSICHLLENEGESSGSALYESLWDDFNTSKSKALLSVMTDFSEPVKMEIFGDFGKKQFLMPKNSAVKKLNLRSKEFKFRVSCDKPFGVNGITFEYKIKGE